MIRISAICILMGELLLLFTTCLWIGSQSLALINNGNYLAAMGLISGGLIIGGGFLSLLRWEVLE